MTKEKDKKTIREKAGQSWLHLNHANWDERAPIHAESSFYNVDRFLEGHLTLGAGEQDDLMPVSGKSLLHLQCHFGLDTLSWARLGAKATGLDFSENAILEARNLAKRANLDATFVCANVYDATDILNTQYDIVYTGIGALCWLPDINGWAEVIARLLKPGGELYLVELHLMHWVFSDDGFDIAYDYFTHPDGELITEAGSYADGKAVTEHNTTRQ